MKIIEKTIISGSASPRIIAMEVTAEAIAQKARPGQFIVLMADEKGERIPLTVVDKNPAKGTIKLIFQEAGFTTRLLGKLNKGDSLYAITGPLGHATEIKKYGRVILVGGGVGIVEIYPVACALKEAGNQIITIIGARTKDLLILERELKAVSGELHAVTDDGSYGKKGFVTDILKELIASAIKHGGPADLSGGDSSKLIGKGLVYAVGPIPMMKKVAEVTKDSGIKTIVSLNALMVDATGMCGCCRVSVAGKTKFSCVDGPEFDAQKVDWDELTKRNKIYTEQEKHICKLGI